MPNEYQHDPYVLRRYFSLALKNLRRRPMRTGLTVAGVALAVTVAVSLGGFMLGYSGAIDKSINMLGFQVMIMAKGCPYEAATMMLKGGTGLLVSARRHVRQGEERSGDRVDHADLRGRGAEAGQLDPRRRGRARTSR